MSEEESSSASFAETNRQHFNNQSASYDTKPWQQKLNQQIADALEERKDWIGIRWAKPNDLSFGRECKLLDYACGTGSITRALGPWVTTVRGIDISENMVQKYNDDAQAAGIKPERVNAVVGDLLADEVPEHLKTPEYYDFDIAVIGLGFHHFENPVRAVERLTERLKHGTGVLLIIDFLPFDDEAQSTDDPWKGTIKNRGFTTENMKKLYQVAKLQKFSFSMLDQPVDLDENGTKRRSVFITRGYRENTTWGKLANWVYDIQMAASEQTHLGPRRAVPDKLGYLGEVKKTTQ